MTGNLFDRIDRLTVPEPFSGCWLWVGNLNNAGYARIRIGGRGGSFKKVHQINFERFKGPIPDGKILRHQCDMACCVNPYHLIPGTRADNVSDMVSRGRQRGPSGEPHHGSVLTQNDIVLIKELYANGIRQVDLSRRFNVSRSHMSKILSGDRWAGR